MFNATHLPVDIFSLKRKKESDSELDIDQEIENIENLDMQSNLINKILQNAIGNKITVEKDAKLAINRSLTTFIRLITKRANIIAKKRSHKNISTSDIFEALEESFKETQKQKKTNHHKNGPPESSIVSQSPPDNGVIVLLESNNTFLLSSSDYNNNNNEGDDKTTIKGDNNIDGNESGGGDNPSSSAASMESVVEYFGGNNSNPIVLVVGDNNN
ncbi:14921_t:CDS:2 [Entrophospora sp. SA101]|nr:14921_t:CDS:2 [Entrophospora sp. SA101]